MLNEKEIINRLKANFDALIPQNVKGIGDDACIIPINDRESYLISKDLLVENIHFRLKYFDAASLAHKALHVNVSDIAAMGGEVTYILLSFAIPKYIPATFIDNFLTHFTLGCQKMNIILLGGDTVAAEETFLISITIIGKAQNRNIKLRTGAKIGDFLFVIGSLGESYAGLIALENRIFTLKEVINRTLRPHALIREGIWLGKQSAVTSLLDISDGLYLDSKNLASASQIGVEIELSYLNPSKELKNACQILNLNYIESMLMGGEDFALLGTANKTYFDLLASDFIKNFSAPLTKIGRIIKEQKVIFKEDGQEKTFKYKPYNHFGEDR